MKIRHRGDGIEAVDHTIEDRDLIAMVNEARDPAEIDRIAATARHRRRARRREADAAAHRPSRRRAHLFGRAPSFRHYWGY
jgi:hypothetical protein